MPPEANSEGAPKGKYVAGSLVETHWPQWWDIHSKKAEIVGNWEWIQHVRYKVGD
jgi:hypothetical protein